MIGPFLFFTYSNVTYRRGDKSKMYFTRYVTIMTQNFYDRKKAKTRNELSFETKHEDFNEEHQNSS